MSDMEYPITIEYKEIKRTINPAITWAGIDTVYTDAKGDKYLGVPMDPPWYHCSKCLAEKSRTVARLGLTSKFCPNCGTELDWKTGFDE